MTDIERGTVIEVRHRMRPYSHWCIMGEDGNVIHVSKKKNEITVDPLDKVLRNATKMTIVEEDIDTREGNWRRASRYVGSPYTYSLTISNCQGWVNQVRFGENTSSQIENAVNNLCILSLFLL